MGGVSILTRIKHARARRRLRRQGFDRDVTGPGHLRMTYTHDRELFVVTPDGSRWEAHPGVEYTCKPLGKVTVNSDRMELIEAGPAREGTDERYGRD